MDDLVFYDRQGKAINLEQFGELHKDKKYKRVDLDFVNGYIVSTVWLGVDYSFCYEHKTPILIFETMIFKDGTFSDLYLDRYSSEEEALKGHKKAVQMVIEGEIKDDA